MGQQVDFGRVDMPPVLGGAVVVADGQLIANPAVVCHRRPEQGWGVRILLNEAGLAIDLSPADAAELIEELQTCLDALDGKFGA